MDMVKKYLLRLPEGLVTLEKEELVRRVKEILKDHPSEHMNAYRVWYEGFEGCGMPGTDVYDVIVETMRSMTDDWKDIGAMRWELYGVVDPSFLNLHYAERQKTWKGVGPDIEMLQHQFHIRAPTAACSGSRSSRTSICAVLSARTASMSATWWRSIPVPTMPVRWSK